MKNLIILFLTLIVACNTTKQKAPVKNSNHSFKNFSVIKLPHTLDEISGLAITKDGRLFCHDDERGVVYQINFNNGRIIKKFQLGTFGIESDFEGIAIAGNKFFLLSSNGILYEFNEGKNLEKVKFKKYELGFSSKFEFESLCYEKTSNSLLLVSKKYSGKKYKKSRAVFSFSLDNRKLNTVPKFIIPLKELNEKFNVKDFYPSGISIRPGNGNYFILSSKGKPVVVSFTKQGKILNAYKLNKKIFVQPEGIEFPTDTTILIANEAKSKRATLVKLSVTEL